MVCHCRLRVLRSPLPCCGLTRPCGGRRFFALFASVFGRKTAAIITSLYLVSSIFGVATIGAGIGQYLGYLGIGSVLAIEILVIAAFCCINIIGISLSGATENVLTTIKTVPLVVIALLLLPPIRPENFVSGSGMTAAGVIATSVIVYWPFTGFEISAIPAEEMKDISLVRRSLILVMVIVAGGPLCRGKRFFGRIRCTRQWTG